jgi:hypothetical protein
MKPSPVVQESIDRIRQSKDGQVFIQFLQQMYQSDTAMMGGNDVTTLHGMLQGKWRRSLELLSIFNNKQGT